MKKTLLLIAAALCGLTLLTSCSGGGMNSPTAFETFYKITNTEVRSVLGMSRDAIYLAWNVESTTPNKLGGNPQLDNAIWLKYADNTLQDTVAMINHGLIFQTSAGLSLNNTMSDVVPMYQADKSVTVETNTPTKIVMKKTIDGVNFGLAVRGDENGVIRYITIYNADVYTDADDTSQYSMP